MATFANGQIPTGQMRQFSGKWGLTSFIINLQAFVNECAANGIHITVAAEQDIYRDYAGQVYQKKRWTALGNPRNAADPGTSNHGLGIAADISGCGSWGTATHKKCEDIARKHGLAFTLSFESWHLEGLGYTKASGNRSITISGAATPSAGVNNGIFNTKLGVEDVKRLQRALGVGDDGQFGVGSVTALQKKIGTPADGQWGVNSTKKLQAFVGTAADGQWGDNTTKSIRAALTAGKFGTVSTLVNINDKLDKNYRTKLQTQLGVNADGDFGSASNKALQKKLGVNPDGLFGKGSIESLQVFIGAGKDGNWGTQTTEKLKQAINASLFAPKAPTLISITDKIGVDYALRLQAALGVSIDGQFGSSSNSALQKKIGAAVDGQFGKGSVEKLQAFIGTAVDGDWGINTTNALKKAIDAGKFGNTQNNVPVPTPVPVKTVDTYKDWVLGIDVSYHQATIDYKKIVASGVKYVTLKVGGADQTATTNRKPAPYHYIDSKFEQHYKGFRDAGIEHIDYYYWQDGYTDPTTQADNFWNAIKDKIKPGELVKYDYETYGAQNPLATPAQVVVFLDKMKKNMTTGTPVFYTYSSMIDTKDFSVVKNAGYPLWIAQYGKNDGHVNEEPNPKYWGKNFSEWQFTSAKKINGYSGDLDASFMNPTARKSYGFVKYNTPKPPVIIAPTTPVEPTPRSPVTPPKGSDKNAWVVGTLTTIGTLIAGLIAYFNQNPIQ